MSRPRTTGSGTSSVWKRRSSTRSRRFHGDAPSVRQLEADAVLSRDRRDDAHLPREGERKVVGERGDLRHLRPGGRRDLVRRHGGTGENVLDLPVDAIVGQRLHEELGVLVERLLVDRHRRVDLGPDEVVDRRQLERGGREGERFDERADRRAPRGSSFSSAADVSTMVGSFGELLRPLRLRRRRLRVGHGRDRLGEIRGGRRHGRGPRRSRARRFRPRPDSAAASGAVLVSSERGPGSAPPSCRATRRCRPARNPR